MPVSVTVETNYNYVRTVETKGKHYDYVLETHMQLSRILSQL